MVEFETEKKRQLIIKMKQFSEVKYTLILFDSQFLVVVRNVDRRIPVDTTI